MHVSSFQPITVRNLLKSELNIIHEITLFKLAITGGRTQLSLLVGISVPNALYVFLNSPTSSDYQKL